jgi:hypothetical protein
MAWCLVKHKDKFTFTWSISMADIAARYALFQCGLTNKWLTVMWVRYCCKDCTSTVSDSHNFSKYKLHFRYGLDVRGSRVRFPVGLGIFLFTTAHPASYPMGTRGSFPGVKRSGREADHSPPSSAEVKERVELFLHPHYAFIAWCSVKAQGQLYLYFYLYFYLYLCTAK